MTRGAGALLQSILQDVVAPSFDEERPAVRTPCVLKISGAAREVACIDEAKSRTAADLRGAVQRGGGGGPTVGHTIVIMERRDMPGDVGGYPGEKGGDLLQLGLAVVEAGDDQRDHFQPDPHADNRPDGVETLTESEDPGVAAKIQEHVDAMHDRLASTGLADRFRFPGFVDDPAIVMSQLDILIHTADQESFGRIIVEAMAAGLPVIGVRGGAVQEIIRHGETGFLAQPDDPLELARYVEQLARDPELRTSMGAAGRKRALAEYSLDASAAGMLKVYEQAMQRPLGTSAAGSNQETAAVE